MVNRLVDQKRVDAAIAAWPLVLQRVPDAQLHIYGDGPLRSSLQALIDARGVTRSVRLHGFSDRIPEAMADASAFLCTSSFEGQNLAISEALASGLPVVAFDVCYGPRDYVGDGGILVAPGDTEGVVTALTTLLVDGDVRAAMSRRALLRSRRLRPEVVGDAFARLLAKDDRAAPVILDDALVFSDDERIERMFDALHRQASHQQILILTCRQRAFQRLGGTALRLEPWQPAA